MHSLQHEKTRPEFAKVGLGLLPVHHLPAIEVFDGGAIRPADTARAPDAAFEHTARPNDPCRDAFKR